ncbi:MAG: hypothetical protein ACOCXJ_01430 [Planctomycetota bacterium]
MQILAVLHNRGVAQDLHPASLFAVETGDQSMRTIATTALLGLAAAGSCWGAAGSDYTIRLSATAWFAEPHGDLDYSAGTLSGNIPTTGDLDLENTEVAPSLEAGVRLPFLFDIYAGYSGYGTEGARRLTEDLKFGDNTYSAGSDIDSELSIDDLYVELTAGVDILGKAGIGGGLALHYVAGEFDLRNDTHSDSFDENFIVPTLAVRAFVNPIESLTLEARGHFIDLAIGDNEVVLVDMDARIIWYPLEVVGVIGGYRLTDYDLDLEDVGVADDAVIDLTLGGPFLGIAAQF